MCLIQEESDALWGECESPLGVVWVRAQPSGISNVLLPLSDTHTVKPGGGDSVPCSTSIHLRARRFLLQGLNEIQEFMNGKREVFSVPIVLRGTAFQVEVWEILQRIPLGKTRTYGEIAREIGTSPRAVGRACGANPVPLLVPCHRVVAQDGSLGGFSGGVAVKERLLAMEARMIASRRSG